ncbi:tyrosine-type recombinase/integrase [Streptomyces sp. NPDC046374]|uniref:tyrosine-type recombinase/integrase n=1 Tax=Streptomyces sp. NPDC046374 TaxID=3154917 RepID=UPI0033E59042
MVSRNVVGPDEIGPLMANGAVPAEHRALWGLMWQSGLRVADALSVDVRDVDFEDGTVTVPQPVRDRGPVSAPVSEEAATLLRKVVGERKEGPLLVNSAGRALSREAAIRWARAVGHGIHDFRPQPHVFESAEA